MTDAAGQEGGFLHPTLPSPPPSAPSTSVTLPTPRAQPLKPSSQKEREFRNYVENRLLEVSGRYERRYNAGVKEGAQSEEGTQGTGYETFAEVVRDLDQIVDVVWVSGTPSLQIPFFLNVALAFSTYIPSFPFSPKYTFELAQKLDIAFSSLLNESNVETGEPLSGFNTGRKVTMTEKIRLRGLVERTRINVARVANEESVDEHSRITELMTDEDEDLMEEDAYTNNDEGVARIYERTIIDLGPSLDGAPNIGIPD